MTIFIAVALILAGGIVFGLVAAALGTINEGRRGVDRAQRRNR